MNSLTLQRTSKAVAWIIAVSMTIAFATPASAWVPRGNTSSAKWISQSPGAQAGGATVVSANAGDVLNFSLTIQNTSPTDVFYSADALLDEPVPYVGAHEIRIGATADTVYDNIFDFTGSGFVNNNRFATFQTGSAVFPGGNLTFNWTMKVKAGLANGTYRFKVGAVQEYDAWFGDFPGPGAGGPTNNLGGRLGGTIFWDIQIGGPVTGGSLNIGVNSTTPGASNIAELAADVPMARLSFTAAAANNALVTSISIRKSGLSADTDVADLKLYDGMTKLGSTQGVNSTTHKATFTGLSWLIPAGTTKVLTIKATVPAAASVGDIIVLGIESAADVTLSGGATVGGTFPSFGNNFTVGSTSVGFLGVTAPTTPAAGNVISGSTAQELASFKFTASSTEGFDVNSISLTEIGTSVDSDVSNMRLTYVGNQIGSAVPSLVNGKVTFTGSPLFTVAAGTNKTIYVVGDIASGVTSQRTVRFEINETSHVVAVGQSSGGTVTIDADAAGTVYTVAQGSTMTIVQGSITLVEDPTNLAAQTYIIGQEQVEMSKIKFSAGSNEGVKITKVIFNESADAVSTDYQNARLYINDSATPIATGGSISTTTITFEDGNGLFTIPQSGNVVITLKIDISTAASADATFIMGIGTADNAYTNLVLYGATSGVKIDSDATHITTMTGVDTGDMSTHEINATGTFVVSNGPSTPAAGLYSTGATNKEFHQFRMQALDEAARVTAVTVRFMDNSAVAGEDVANVVATGDVTNAKLYWWNGTAWLMLDDVASPSSGVATFSFDHTIPRNVTETFKVVADVPTGSVTTYLFTGVDGTADTGDIWDVVTATGVSSGGTLNSGEMTGSSDSSVFTYTAPILTVLASTVPATRSIVVNSTDALLGKFFLTANDVEDIRVSTMKISFDQDAGNMASASDADTDLANVYLRFDDGGTWRTTTTKSVTTGTPDNVTFTGSDINTPNEWFAPKGGTLVVEIRGDVVGATSVTLTVGMTATATDVVAAGMYSGTSATIYDSGNDAYDAIWESPVITLASTGTLAVTTATDTPVVQQVTASYGATINAPTFFRAKMTATNEAIKVDAIRATVTDQGSAGEDDNFAGTVRVYEGGTMSGNVLTGGTLVGTGTLAPTAADAAVDIVFSTPVTITDGGTKYLTLIADLNSVVGGADSGDVPYLGITSDVESGLWTSGDYNNKLNIRATGVSSGDVITDANDGGATAHLKGSAAYVVKTKLGMAVNASSPTGTATRQANHTVMKLNLTNTSADTDARFRAGAQNPMTALATDFTSGGSTVHAGTWSESGNSTIAASAVAYIDAGGSLLVTVGADATPVVLNTFDAAADLSGYTGMGFWYNNSDASENLTVTLTGAGAGSHTVNPGTNNAWEFVLIPFATATTPFTGLTTVTAISITAASTNADTWYLDSFVFYKDFLKVDVTSNVGLWANTGLTSTPVVTLKDAASNTSLATGYLAGTFPTTFVSTSQGSVYFIPTTEMAIPVSGKTYNVVTDTTVFITATSRDLTMSIDLGSATSAGVISSGNVLWNDNSSSSAIGWVDSADSPLSRSLNF